MAFGTHRAIPSDIPSTIFSVEELARVIHSQWTMYIWRSGVWIIVGERNPLCLRQSRSQIIREAMVLGKVS